MGLDKIVKCNTEKPYIFISYSSCDKEVVWADVQEYQRRGYNIWLDEKNLDKTNSSWKDDAMAAITDFDCQLVVFYVSRNSLTSEPCFNEMMTTRSDKAKILHEDKPVPFIAVDAEPIGNIIDFKDEIFKEIRGSEKWNKTEKTSKIMVMSKFIEEFFNSNNERVRIHDRTDESYISQYYQEITNYFHPETRNAAVEKEAISRYQESSANSEIIFQEPKIEIGRKSASVLNKENYWKEFVEYAFYKSENQEFLKSGFSVAPVADRNWHALRMGTAKVQVELSFNTQKNTIRTALLVYAGELLEQLEEAVAQTDISEKVIVNRESKTKNIHMLQSVDGFTGDRIAQFEWFMDMSCKFRKVVAAVLK